MKFSVVIPVYNRPGELADLLESLATQQYRDFEVIVVDDGSENRSDTVADSFRDRLTIRYFFKPNSGPGPSRNFGFKQASGDYFVIFDSDCILPPDYFNVVVKALDKDHLDAWGGPDRASENFTPLQQAMGFTMSAFLTTGGIRGGRRAIGRFQPRSFNMGFSRDVYKATGGFHFDRYAEDIELSIRMHKAGFKVTLLPEAFVYHKRRTSLSQFYRQVVNFGRGRALVGKKHPGQVKVTHLFPFLFILGFFGVIILGFVKREYFVVGLGAYALYLILIFGSALRYTKNFMVSLLSVPTAVVQLVGYGIGFIAEWTGIKRF